MSVSVKIFLHSGLRAAVSRETRFPAGFFVSEISLGLYAPLRAGLFFIWSFTWQKI